MKTESEALLLWRIRNGVITKKDRISVVEGISPLPIMNTLLKEPYKYECIFKCGAEIFSIEYTRSDRSGVVLDILYPTRIIPEVEE